MHFGSERIFLLDWRWSSSGCRRDERCELLRQLARITIEDRRGFIDIRAVQDCRRVAHACLSTDQRGIRTVKVVERLRNVTLHGLVETFVNDRVLERSWARDEDGVVAARVNVVVELDLCLSNLSSVAVHERLVSRNVERQKRGETECSSSADNSSSRKVTLRP